MRLTLSNWTVDYGMGSGEEPIRLPHAWCQDVPVRFEGPAIYKIKTHVPSGAHLMFHGVSHEAVVSIDGAHFLTHVGPWDAFTVDLSAHRGKEVEISVAVTKAGGERFPVRRSTAGFLPYVFNTFGGIYKPVELVHDEPLNLELPAKPRLERLLMPGTLAETEKLYVRGLLHWGWYPELGHQNPPEETIREEIAAIKELGFNLIKFCLWLPPHEYLQQMAQANLKAWIELPLWDPEDDPENLQFLGAELTRVVRQYAHHSNVLAWTAGCELRSPASRRLAAEMAAYVSSVTGCNLVKDSSGGAEMYGSDLTEFGTFFDFHPYCEPHFYPLVLDCLRAGPRRPMPSGSRPDDLQVDSPRRRFNVTLLGEFNDADVHRDLSRIGDELPYWASTLAELNDKGVRWQYDLPAFVQTSRFANEPTASRHARLMESSRTQALFMRKFAVEAVRQYDRVNGYVITGWRDTPMTSSGLFDDWGTPRFSAAECETWNGPACLFLIPYRNPEWVDGGNRPGWRDPLNHFLGLAYFRVGCQSQEALVSGLAWEIETDEGKTVAWGASPKAAPRPGLAVEVGEIVWEPPAPGAYRLEVRFGPARNEWPIWVVERYEAEPNKNLLLLGGEATTPKPFWREAAYEFNDDAFWAAVPFANRWERLLPVCADRVLDPEWLAANFEGKIEPLMNRIDTRTYEEHPVIARIGDKLITTLRPHGGLGIQPNGLKNNPAGAALLQALNTL